VIGVVPGVDRLSPWSPGAGGEDVRRRRPGGPPVNRGLFVVGVLSDGGAEKYHLLLSCQTRTNTMSQVVMEGCDDRVVRVYRGLSYV
jgi:hypothetical protein